MKDKSTKAKMVKLIVKGGKFPPLTKAQRAEIEALKKMRDEDIDYSDIPPLSSEFWKNAKPLRDSHLYKPRKESTTVRLDSDILAWLKSAGPGYQTRINSILRRVMLKDDKK
jgi:uncharacterized protein (DUF4415 family)